MQTVPTSREEAVPLWLHVVYGHDGEHPQPKLAGQLLSENSALLQGDLYVACATGDLETVRRAVEALPELVDRPISGWRCPGCQEPLDRTPLIAATHSTLLQLPEFRNGLHECAKFLLAAGANPNQRHNEGGHELSPLYGAAGKNHDPGMTRILLAAGADPNDGESLYHSMEDHGLEVARILLEGGAVVEGTNALQHCLDYDSIEKLRLLLKYTKDSNDPTGVARPLHWAIRRGRSVEHIRALLDAGADPGGAYRLAVLNGLPEVARLLPPEPLTLEDQFVGACTSNNETGARLVLAEHPDLLQRLPETHLKQLPQMVESGNHDAARLMVNLGWPIAARGGDWNATALNHAVYQGNAPLTRFLLEHGASWTERHAFDDNVHGTLCWASRNMSPANDYVGCAKALVDHGMPILELEGDYSDAVAEFLDSERARLRQTR